MADEQDESEYDGSDYNAPGFEVGELPEGWEVLTSATFEQHQAPIVNAFTNLGTVLTYIMTAIMMGGIVTAGVAPAGSTISTSSRVSEQENAQEASGSATGADDDDPLGRL